MHLLHKDFLPNICMEELYAAINNINNNKINNNNNNNKINNNKINNNINNNDSTNNKNNTNDTDSKTASNQNDKNQRNDDSNEENNENKPPINEELKNIFNQLETFNKLVDQANTWLANNPDFHIKSCESITWCQATDKMAEGNRREMFSEVVMTRSITTGGITCFCRGLRVWYYRGQLRKNKVMLCFCDVLPGVDERLQDLVDKLNKKFNNKLSKVSMLNIETLTVPIMRCTGLRSEANGWVLSCDQDCYSVFVLRSFYVRGTKGMLEQLNCEITKKTKISLVIQDFVPRNTEYGYEEFENLLERAEDWVKEQEQEGGCYVINMQSSLVQQDQEPLDEKGPLCFHCTPAVHSSRSIDIFRIVRVVCLFVKTPDTSKTITNPSSRGLVFESFVPSKALNTETTVSLDNMFSRQSNEAASNDVSLKMEDGLMTEVCMEEEPYDSDGDLKLEDINSLMQKVSGYLKTYDNEILSIETVVNPLHMYYPSHHSPHHRITFLISVRVFAKSAENPLKSSNGFVSKNKSHKQLTTSSSNFNNADQQSETAALLESKEHQLVQQQTQQPAAQEGGIFLGNVVGGNFKYRFIALALSAFTCMSVIVAVSVIYAN